MASYKTELKKRLLKKGNCALGLYYPLVMAILVRTEVKHTAIPMPLYKL